jgi:hypothetical protein
MFNLEEEGLDQKPAATELNRDTGSHWLLIKCRRRILQAYQRYNQWKANHFCRSNEPDFPPNPSMHKSGSNPTQKTAFESCSKTSSGHKLSSRERWEQCQHRCFPQCNGILCLLSTTQMQLEQPWVYADREHSQVRRKHHQRQLRSSDSQAAAAAPAPIGRRVSHYWAIHLPIPKVFRWAHKKHQFTRTSDGNKPPKSPHLSGTWREVLCTTVQVIQDAPPLHALIDSRRKS